MLAITINFYLGLSLFFILVLFLHILLHHHQIQILFEEFIQLNFATIINQLLQVRVPMSELAIFIIPQLVIVLTLVNYVLQDHLKAQLPSHLTINHSFLLCFCSKEHFSTKTPHDLYLLDK